MGRVDNLNPGITFESRIPGAEFGWGKDHDGRLHPWTTLTERSPSVGVDDINTIVQISRFPRCPWGSHGDTLQNIKNTENSSREFSICLQRISMPSEFSTRTLDTLVGIAARPARTSKASMVLDYLGESS